MRTATALLIVIGIASSPTVEAGQVINIAGNGKPVYTGDGGKGVDAGVNAPFGVSLGPDGALYICEVSNHIIRRLDEQTGLISTVAGVGKKGYAGDGGPALKALLNEPYEVRFDEQGNMFFVEMQNHLVRRVDAKTGIISTVAGMGVAGFQGDDGPAIKAQFNRPHSIALDNAGNLYVCDIGNHRIRRVELATGIITTFSGTGERKPTPDGAPVKGTPLNGPRALDFDGHGNLYLALREGNAVYRINLQSQTLQHLAGTGQTGYEGDGGDAKQALLSGPKGITVGPTGDIYLADTERHTIRVIRAGTGIIETVLGDGNVGDGPLGDPRKCRLARPHGVYVDDNGNVYVGDSSNNRVRKLLAD